MLKAVSKMIAVAAAIMFPGVAFAAEGAASGVDGSMIAIGVGVTMGIAALGGTLGQSKAVASALDAIGRNPSASGKIFVPMILGLALIESLVILAFVICFQLIGKM